MHGRHEWKIRAAGGASNVLTLRRGLSRINSEPIQRENGV
jgi:hypothetical protein